MSSNNIIVSGSLVPSSTNTPMDARSRVETLADIATIENAYEGLLIYCIENKKIYKVKTLKDDLIGGITISDALIDEYEELSGAGALAVLEQWLSSDDEDDINLNDILTNLNENHSFELGFDNVPTITVSDVYYEDPDTGETDYTQTVGTEDTYPFQSLVVGISNYYGTNSIIYGNSNNTPEDDDSETSHLGNVMIYGDHNKTYQFQTIFGGCNEFTAATNIFVVGQGNSSEENCHGAIILGNTNEVNGKGATVIGTSNTVDAELAFVIGRHGTLDDSTANRGAFAIAGGTTNGDAIGFIHRSNKAVENPLYNPDNDTDNTGTDDDGEEAELYEQSFTTEYMGQLKAVTLTIAVTDNDVVTLDADYYSRWLLDGEGDITLQLSNWSDGCKGELIIDTSDITPTIPADWVTLGADITTTPGLYVLEIAQIGTTVFYAIKYPNSGGVSSSIGDTITIIDGYWYIDGVKTAPATGADGGTFEISVVDALPETPDAETLYLVRE